MKSSACPTDETLVAFIEGHIDLESLSQHIDSCPICPEVMAELAMTASQSEDEARGALNRVGRYEIVEEIGAGAMGIVYRAIDQGLQRTVAIKLLQPELLRGANAEAARQRLLREGRALAALSHPNVLPVYEVEQWRDQVFIAMEFVDGTTVGDWARRESVGSDEVLGAILQAGEGIEAAHRAGIVHRDVKPLNMLIGRDGRVRVTDFGLAKDDRVLNDREQTLTATGAQVGTPAYMAPEVLAGREAGPLADQFALCVSLVECLTGDRPLAGATVSEVAGIEPRLALVIARGLSMNPLERYGSVGGLVAALRGDDSANARTVRWRMAWVLWAIGLVAIAVLGFGVRSWWQAPAKEVAARRVAQPAIPPNPVDAESAAVTRDAGVVASEGAKNNAISSIDATVKDEPARSNVAKRPPPDAALLANTPSLDATAPQGGDAGYYARLTEFRDLQSSAIRARVARKPKACLRLLNEASEILPNAPKAILDAERARCLMLAGRCDEGAVSLRRSFAENPTISSQVIEHAVVDMQDTLCPLGAIVGRADKIRALIRRTTNTQSIAECRALVVTTGDLLKAVPTAEKSTVAGAYSGLSMCLAEAGDCSGALAVERAFLRVRSPHLSASRQEEIAVSRVQSCIRK